MSWTIANRAKKFWNCPNMMIYDLLKIFNLCNDGHQHRICEITKTLTLNRIMFVCGCMVFGCDWFWWIEPRIENYYHMYTMFRLMCSPDIRDDQLLWCSQKPVKNMVFLLKSLRNFHKTYCFCFLMCKF